MSIYISIYFYVLHNFAIAKAYVKTFCSFWFVESDVKILINLCEKFEFSRYFLNKRPNNLLSYKSNK